jgi:molybdopterin synthase catalytic subunit
MGIHVRVGEEDFEPQVELGALQGEGVGGVVSFVGIARARGEGGTVEGILLEHYPGMTEASLEEIAAEAVVRWRLLGVRIVHRVGWIPAGGRIVLAAVAAAHRGPAFEACEYVVDQLKTRAPFWKAERGPQGDTWVDAREADEAATRHWLSGVPDSPEGG